MQESYGVLREHVESVIKDVLGLSGVTFKVGLYFHCKTAYLLGILRNVDVAILAQSSQQECIDNAHDYACNTVTIKVHKTILHKDLNVVKKWLLILLTFTFECCLFNVKSTSYVWSVLESANWFIVHHLWVSPTHLRATSPAYYVTSHLS